MKCANTIDELNYAYSNWEKVTRTLTSLWKIVKARVDMEDLEFEYDDICSNEGNFVEKRERHSS